MCYTTTTHTPSETMDRKPRTSASPSARSARPSAIRLVASLADACRARGLTFGTAESCTGGLIGATVTNLAGVSDVFAGGIISYSNAVKERCLGVPPATLRRHGAVSAETALAMAEGACRALGCEAAVSVTGIAGPGGAVPGKSVGTVYVAAVAGGVPARVRRFDWGADQTRAAIRRATVRAALSMLAEVVDSLPLSSPSCTVP